MKKTPTNTQDLRRKIYIKAKAETDHRFWGLYVHVCKIEILGKAYSQAKQNNGAPGIDGVTFEAIEKGEVTEFLKNIQQELLERRYKPMATRKQPIPKNNGKVRILGIPTIRDRVVQGALKLVLEPIFEADFKDGSYGYRPKRSPHQAIESMKQAILLGKTQIIDLDIRAYFDSVRHDLLFNKVARRVNDDEIMGLLKLICKASGKRGIPQGGPLSPLLANIFLNGIDEMLEEVKNATKWNFHTYVGYIRFADDLVVLVSGHPTKHRLINPLFDRLKEELRKLDLQINDEKTRIVDLAKGESFSFLGFDVRLVKALSGKMRPQTTPKKDAKSKLVTKVRDVCKRYTSQPIERVIELINPIIRGWVNYFRSGNSGRCFKNIRRWIENKIRRHLARARGRKGFGWERWSNELIYTKLGLYNDYSIRYYQGQKVKPA